MRDDDGDTPRRCPGRGSRAVHERRETGGGWRRVSRCADCGARITPTED